MVTGRRGMADRGGSIPVIYRAGRAAGAVVAAVVMLAACTGPNEVALEMLLEQFRPPAAFSGGGLDPRYEYIRITSNGRPAFMVKGMSSGLSRQSVAPDSVWYSADREVMFLRSGRIVRTLGTPVELHRVDTRFPDWTQIAEGQSVSYARQRDFARPGRYGVTEQVEVRRLSASAKPVKPAQWLGNPALPSPDSLIWFEERVVQSGPVDAGQTQLPVSRFAVLMPAQVSAPVPAPVSASSPVQASPLPMVIYSEQCLAENLCLTVQAWPVQVAQNAKP